MKIFNIQQGRNIGILKTAIKDAILDGKYEIIKKKHISFLLKLQKK